MNLSALHIFAGIIFGLLGYSFFRIGKKQQSMSLIVVSLALMLFPYFITNIYAVWGIGLALTYFAFRGAK